MSGVAPDGGLYMPERIECLSKDALHRLAGQPYARWAETVLSPFLDQHDRDGEKVCADLAALLNQSYSGFLHPAVAPLKQLSERLWLLELFHGPTFAFKDFALQPLGRLMERQLKLSGKRQVVLAATSGDTGSAAIDALAGRAGLDIVVLFPHGRVSEIQRRQMTAVNASNVHVAAIEGTFDDCQALVKELFSDMAFTNRVPLAAVNSINWARIALQTVYYVRASMALRSNGPVHFSVPTGNFGNVFSGWVARAMGAPVGTLIAATNENDIVARALTTGVYSPGAVAQTLSPSMDIQVASNFERMIFEASRRDAPGTSELMSGFSKSRYLAIGDAPLSQMQESLKASAVTQREALDTMARIYQTAGEIVDPHTAIGIAAAERFAHMLEGPIVCLATAHPAKFPDAVKQAIGQEPACPQRLQALHSAKERVTRLPNEARALQAFIRDRTDTHHA